MENENPQKQNLQNLPDSGVSPPPTPPNEDPVIISPTQAPETPVQNDLTQPPGPGAGTPPLQPTQPYGQPVAPQVSQQTPPDPINNQPKQPVFEQQGFKQPNKKPMKKLLTILVVLIALAGFGVGGYVLYSQFSNNVGETIDVTVPDGWTELNSELGFTVKAPQGWSAQLGASSDIEGLQAECKTLSEPPSFDPETLQEGSLGNLPFFISACKQSFEGLNTKEEFIEKISNTEMYKDELGQFGIDVDKIIVTQKVFIISGKEWLKLDVAFPGQASTTYYLWNVDHMVTLTAIEQSDSQEALNKLDTEYLQPMSASLTLL